MPIPVPLIPGLNEAIEKRKAHAAAVLGAMPLVPAWLVSLAAALVPVAALGNAYLPHPWSVAAGILALVSALLAGVAAPQLVFSRPVIPLAMVPAALTAAGWLGTLAQTLPNPLAHLGCMLASGVLAALAGKALPPPTRV